jgi:hypothetical protein
MEAVDERLIPINGLIALLRGDGGWPRSLGDAGFQRHKFEVPISTPKGEIKADALIYRTSPALVLLSECKSGRNIDSGQAGKYLSADQPWLKRTGALPPALRHSDAVEVATLFVGRDEYRADLEQGLTQLEINAPLLTVGESRIQLSGAGRVGGLDDFIHDHNSGLPPGRIPIDHQSEDEQILELLVPQIVAAQAQLEDLVSVEAICARILPEWGVLAHGAQGDFIRRIVQLLTGLQQTEFKGQIRYERLKEPHTRGRLHIVDSPAKRDPRGRTQAFQAQQRKGQAVLGRKGKRPSIAGQISLDELAEQGGLADD